MTRTLSSVKRDRVSSVIIDVIKRQRSVWLTHLILIFALSPLTLGITMAVEANRAVHYGGYSYTPPELPTGYLGMGVTMALACLLPLLLFSYLNNRQALDTIHALPVRRDTLFWGNYLAGLLMITLPHLLFQGSCGYVLWILDERDGGNFLRVMFSSLVAMLAFYHLMIFIIVNCGTLFESIVYFGLLNVSWPALVAVLFNFISETTFGYLTPVAGIQGYLYSFSPFYQLIEVGVDGPWSWTSPLISLGVSLLALLLGYLLYRHRKSEAAGQSFAYKPLFYVCAVMISVCVGVGFFLLTRTGGGFTSEDIYLILLSNVFGFLTYFVLDTIRNRGFKGFKKTLLVGFTGAIATTAFCYSCVATGAFGYETRIPVLSRIESVTVDWGANVSYWIPADGTVTNIEDLERIRSFHRSVAANVDLLEDRYIEDAVYREIHSRYGFDDGTYPSDAYDMGNYDSVKLTYHLRGGDTVTRRWQIPLTMTYPIYQVMQGEEYRQSVADALIAEYDEMAIGKSRELYMSYEDLLQNDYFSMHAIKKEDGTEPQEYRMMQEFLQAIKEDLTHRKDDWLLDPQSPARGFISIGGHGLMIYASDRNTCALLDRYSGFYLHPDKEITYTERAYDINGEQITVAEKLPDEEVERVVYYMTTDEMPLYYEWNYGLLDFYRTNHNGYDIHNYADKYMLQPEFGVTRYSMTREELEALREYITPVGFYETPHNVLSLDGLNYLVHPDAVQKVEEILSRAEAMPFTQDE